MNIEFNRLLHYTLFPMVCFATLLFTVFTQSLYSCTWSLHSRTHTLICNDGQATLAITQKVTSCLVAAGKTSLQWYENQELTSTSQFRFGYSFIPPTLKKIFKLKHSKNCKFQSKSGKFQGQKIKFLDIFQRLSEIKIPKKS